MQEKRMMMVQKQMQASPLSKSGRRKEGREVTFADEWAYPILRRPFNDVWNDHTPLLTKKRWTLDVGDQYHFNLVLLGTVNATGETLIRSKYFHSKNPGFFQHEAKKKGEIGISQRKARIFLK